MAIFARNPCDLPVCRRGGPQFGTVQAGTWVLVAAIAGSSMGSIDGTAVNVALPLVQRDLHADAAGLQWIVEGYSLFLSALILVGGSLGDRFGRRAIFLLGIVIFALSSLACGLAPTIEFLNAARCVQGIGAALSIPGSLALISATFSGEERGRAIGTWSGFSAITTALGPVLGGWLAQTISWRAVFFINLPLAALVVAVSLFGVPESRDEEAPKRIDVIGACLATTGLGALVYGLIGLQGVAMNSWFAWVTALGCALLLAFVLYERFGTAHPMLRSDLFQSRPFAGANLYTLLLYAALGGALYFLPFNLINVQGYTPVAAGASFLPFILIMFVASRWSGGLVDRIGARTPLVVGAVLAAAGFFAFARTGIGASYWMSFFPAAVILGLGGAFFVAPLTTTAMDAVAVSQAGIASGINNAVSRAAGLIAIAGLGLALAGSFDGVLQREVTGLHISPPVVAALARQRNTILSGHVSENAIPPAERAVVTTAIRDAYVAGFRTTMLIAAGLSLLAAIIAWFWDWNSRSPRGGPSGRC
ncbi:MAG: MFS transporter [Candidatus Eremiobacteraeota bacterium]|nr:MFS transporter [Candidatus Eremiobacteraeota bacterium]